MVGTQSERGISILRRDGEYMVTVHSNESDVADVVIEQSSIHFDKLFVLGSRINSPFHDRYKDTANCVVNAY